MMMMCLQCNLYSADHFSFLYYYYTGTSFPSLMYISLTIRKFETIVVQPRPRLCLSPFRLYLTTLSGQSKPPFSLKKKNIKTGKWRHKIVAGCDEDTASLFSFMEMNYSRTRDDVVRLIQPSSKVHFHPSHFTRRFFRVCVVDLEKWGRKNHFTTKLDRDFTSKWYWTASTCNSFFRF